MFSRFSDQAVTDAEEAVRLARGLATLSRKSVYVALIDGEWQYTYSAVKHTDHASLIIVDYFVYGDIRGTRLRHC